MSTAETPVLERVLGRLHQIPKEIEGIDTSATNNDSETGRSPAASTLSALTRIQYFSSQQRIVLVTGRSECIPASSTIGGIDAEGEGNVHAQ